MFLALEVFQFDSNINLERMVWKFCDNKFCCWKSKKSLSLSFNIYCKVVSSRMSRLVAHPRIFRLFMKGKFDDYLLWSLNKKVQNWIVDRSTARDFTVNNINRHYRVPNKRFLRKSYSFWTFFPPTLANFHLISFKNANSPNRFLKCPCLPAYSGLHIIRISSVF